jgi:hypothetical protein
MAMTRQHKRLKVLQIEFDLLIIIFSSYLTLSILKQSYAFIFSVFIKVQKIIFSFMLTGEGMIFSSIFFKRLFLEYIACLAGIFDSILY